MILTELQKLEIIEYYEKIDDVQSLDISEIVEETLDYLTDEGIVNLYDDEDGDIYEEINNLVWEFIEEVQS
jgi:hypothetical protein